jgi:hypothetical protein
MPLPRYTRRVWSKARNTWTYYFDLSAWNGHVDEERGKCPVGSEPLGDDYEAAVRRVEQVLLPAFDSWRTQGLIDLMPARQVEGSFDWMLSVYRGSAKFKKLSRGQRELHEAGFALIGQHQLKDGRTLGQLQLTDIDTGVVDRLYEKLLPLLDATGAPVPLLDDATGEPVRNKEGEIVYRERRTTVNHAMKSCRRAWNVAFRLHRNIVPAANPFAKMGLIGADGGVTEAAYPELVAAVAKLDALGLRSLAAALMVTWEWLQREDHIFTAFKLEHYRPKEHPHEVLIVHPKTGAEVWVPLFEKDASARFQLNRPLFPELMARMDALKRDRIGVGLFFVRDWGNRRPWATDKGDIDLVRKKTKAALKAAELRQKLSFTSFRHGGFTELGDADLTDAQIRALSRQKSTKIVQGYVKRTQQQIIDGTKKRRGIRPAAEEDATADQLSFDAVLGAKGLR